MWMLIGLAGILAASSMVDLFSPGADAAPDDGPDDGRDGDSDASAGSVDLLASQDIEAQPPPPDLLATLFDADDPDMDEIATQSDGGANTGYEPQGRAVPGAPGDSEEPDWYDDGFISSDAPPQPPASYYIDAGDGGDPAAGGDGDDVIEGGAGDDWLDGQGGSDQLVGGEGNDTLIGGTGDDTLLGGDGDDDLSSGAGQGVLIGGAGNDAMTGGAQDDSLFGGSGNDSLQGGWGDDVLSAGRGQDVLMGGDGQDTLYGFTPGEDGMDVDGADYLNGGAGDDMIVLGSGDIANGGDGSDLFVLGDWVDPDNPPQITDFNPASDTLTIAYDAGASLPEITTAYDSELGGMRVLVDGEVVAVVTGLDELDPDQITLMALTGGV